MIDPMAMALAVTSIVATSGAIGSIVWGDRWRRAARKSDADARHQRFATACAEDRAHEWRATAERLAQHNVELTDKLRERREIREPLEPKPSWHRQRDAKGHFIKAGASTTA